MNEISYDTRKDLPNELLHKLFMAVGWSEDGDLQPDVLNNFNIGFINSTVVYSAWMGEQLIGCIRVLSDKMFRSVIYDLAVLPEYQGLGIGKELVRKCISCFPNSEWLVQTEQHIAGYYEKLGFTVYKDRMLTIPCKLFSVND